MVELGSLREMIAAAKELWAGCSHARMTTPRRDGEGEYTRCLDCGGRLKWAWGDQRPIPPPIRLIGITSKEARGVYIVPQRILDKPPKAVVK